MAPQIHLAPTTVTRLQKHAIPLVDDFDTVINRVLDEVEGKSSEDKQNGHAQPFNAGASTNLTHTKLLSAKIGGKAISKSAAHWNGVLFEAIRQAAAKLGDNNAVKSLVIVNHVVGDKQGEGYYSIPEAGISVQGQNSNNAWKAASHILKAVNIPAEIRFMWYDNEKAARPGQTGTLSIKAD